MKLKRLFSDLWTICAVVDIVDGVEHCHIEEFLHGLRSQYAASVVKMLALLEHIATTPSGPRQLPDVISHQIDKQERIWQFTKGDLRITWFYDEAQVIVCAHGFIKDTQRTTAANKKAAIDVRKSYLAAKAKGKIEVI